ncbi:hypothetical protein DPSP01_007313 [Paraphaeosphaeria sporulosa]|uniref:Uncharacterized protein n=1 Tax=Paraphaeosphaeria sporulosa TaxID=1460663 RepID=A0A177C5P9_9PLEO|nr:uncharacterized protein CC84DRAFT_1220563 [Paraphaeosphaeria sporulosa]OAG02209.1 hypothetical protein CC84DRAFT_1220563 [Paraphaeosphaeria sporulosa]
MSYYRDDPYSRHPPTHAQHTTTHTSYPDTPSSNYFARLSEKAAPAGTIHLNSYDTSPCDYRSTSDRRTSAYRTSGCLQPVYYARSPERVVREVREVREPERYVDREPVRVERVERVVREREGGTGKEAGHRRDGREREDRGIVGKGAGAIWKALGGR